LEIPFKILMYWYCIEVTRVEAPLL
jgi:hypothetical protein